MLVFNEFSTYFQCETRPAPPRPSLKHIYLRPNAFLPCFPGYSMPAISEERLSVLEFSDGASEGETSDLVGSCGTTFACDMINAAFGLSLAWLCCDSLCLCCWKVLMVFGRGGSVIGYGCAALVCASFCYSRSYRFAFVAVCFLPSDAHQ